MLFQEWHLLARHSLHVLGSVPIPHGKEGCMPVFFIPLGKHCAHKPHTIFLSHHDASMCILYRYVLLCVLSSSPQCTYKHTRALCYPPPSSPGSLFCSSTTNTAWYTASGASPAPIRLNGTDLEAQRGFPGLREKQGREGATIQETLRCFQNIVTEL